MEICVLSLQDLDELQLSHLWHFNVQMTSAATEEQREVTVCYCNLLGLS